MPAYTIRLSDDLRKAVRVAAAEEDKSMNQYIVDVLTKETKKEESMDTRIYAYCKVCNTVVYREPGKWHGDGDLDTEENPVWLVWSDPEDYEGDIDKLETITCGCND